MEQNLNKTGIYVHIPFCYKKCDYCDFYSLTDYTLQKKYFDALLRNIDIAWQKYGARQVDSLFFGGGTPSSVDGVYIKEVICKLKSRFDFDDDCEITIEANPMAVDRKKLEMYKLCGINRISMGVQSGHDSELSSLGRIHNYRGFLNSYYLCRDVGFDNINLDVMMGIPGQSEKGFINTLEKLISLDPEHISAYMLSIEENTPFGKRRESLVLPSEDEVVSMYKLCHSILCDSGYSHYEISNFAKCGRECRHNLKYWTGGDYLSFGPAAHSYMDGVRYGYRRDIMGYINSVDFSDMLCDVYAVDDCEKKEDEIIFGLRLSDGIDLKILSGYDSQKRLDKYIEMGYAVIKNGRLCLTPDGMLISNSIISDILI